MTLTIHLEPEQEKNLRSKAEARGVSVEQFARDLIADASTSPESLQAALARAPVERKELSEDTVAKIRRAEQALTRGEGIPHEEILKEFGLKQ